jgi:hypothetical protein
MNTDYIYMLESRKVTGKAPKKFVCPKCGKKRFVRYVDTNNGCQYVDETVGKCDREHHCGYHYTPSDYFHDHPWLKPPGWLQQSDWHKKSAATTTQSKRLDEVLQPLSPEIATLSHSPLSTFWQWMIGDCKERLHLSDTNLARVYDDYQLGSTHESDVIFFQIDEEKRIHTGHIMQYGPDGHRLSYQNWLHSILMKNGQLPENWTLQQCFFGQHLLKRYPEKTVCLVESEKTAVILAALLPEYVWLATCGSSGLSVEKFACLKGRQIKVIPDSGCYEKWYKILLNVKDVDYVITDQMEAYEPNTDLADVFLGEARLAIVIYSFNN